MLKLYSPERADRIIRRYSGHIEAVSRRYGIPPAYMKAVLYKEIIAIDILDPVADLLVALNWLFRRGRPFRAGKGLLSRILNKTDSSTGYAQIFARVGIGAVNYAARRGLDTPEALGFDKDPDSGDPAQVHALWRRLLHDRKLNITLGVLNLIAAAEEMNGHTDFARYTPEETKRAFTRYNADVRHVTPYGEETYGYYLGFLDRGSSEQ